MQAKTPEAPVQANLQAFDHVVLIAIPDQAYKTLEAEASRRGMRLSQAIKQAFDLFLAHNSKPAQEVQLLTEGAKQDA
jgi:hypothetical protein